LVIAIDFDGTIVEDKYPEIGEPKIFAFETLHELIKARHQLILWTTRTGVKLEEAVDYCAKRGIHFYAINRSYPEEKFDGTTGRKINCELFISHKNIGGLPGWGEIFQYVQTLDKGFPSAQKISNPNNNTFISRVFKKLGL
jgi:hypothetical protein